MNQNINNFIENLKKIKDFSQKGSRLSSTMPNGINSILEDIKRIESNGNRLYSSFLEPDKRLTQLKKEILSQTKFPDYHQKFVGLIDQSDIPGILKPELVKDISKYLNLEAKESKWQELLEPSYLKEYNNLLQNSTSRLESNFKIGQILPDKSILGNKIIGEHPILANPSSKLRRILGFQSIIESVMCKNGMLPIIESLKRDIYDTATISKEIALRDDLFNNISNLVSQIDVDLMSQQKSPSLSKNILNSIKNYSDFITKTKSKINLVNNSLLDESLFENGLIESVENLSSFFTKTKFEINCTDNLTLKNALNLSLKLAEFQFATSTDLLSKYFESIDLKEDKKSDHQNLSNKANSNLYDNQKNELVSIVEKEEEEKVYSDDQLIESIPTFEINSKMHDIGKLIIHINQTCKIQGKEEIFKMTTRMYESTLQLFNLIAVDQQTFTNVVNYLCIIIYEGAGKDKLRFIEGKTGVLTKNECDFIWNLKHLRSKWLLHDADHGNQSSINKKWKNISNSLHWFGLPKQPLKQEEYKLLQKNILIKAEEFLFLLISKLENE